MIPRRSEAIIQILTGPTRNPPRLLIQQKDLDVVGNAFGGTIVVGGLVATGLPFELANLLVGSMMFLGAIIRVLFDFVVGTAA